MQRSKANKTNYNQKPSKFKLSMCRQKRKTQFSASTPFPCSLKLSNEILISIKELKCDTFPLNTDSLPNCKIRAFDFLLACFLCCVSTRQLLSLKWQPSTSKAKRKSLTVHTPSWRASPPFHSFSQFCWAVPLWSLASLTRLPNSVDHMSFSVFKCLAGNTWNLIKMPSLVWGYFKEESSC